MTYVAIWLQACLHWRCAYFQTLSWNDTIFVVDWDILYKLCGSANKWSKGFVLSGKIWWQFFSSNKACSKYHPKYDHAQIYALLVYDIHRVPQSHLRSWAVDLKNTPCLKRQWKDVELRGYGWGSWLLFLGHYSVLISAFTHTQNSPVELRRRYQTNLTREYKPWYCLVFFL